MKNSNPRHPETDGTDIPSAVASSEGGLLPTSAGPHSPIAPSAVASSEGGLLPTSAGPNSPITPSAVAFSEGGLLPTLAGPNSPIAPSAVAFSEGGLLPTSAGPNSPITPSAVAFSEGGLLLIAIGNDLRGDDGLGWAFLEKAEQENLFLAETAYRYQLQVEDAGLVAGFNTVIFIDASKEPVEGGYALAPCLPAPAFEFTTHVLKPESVLYLCRELYGKSPDAFTLGISGTFWGLQQGLSKAAQANLEAACNGLRQAVNSV